MKRLLLLFFLVLSLASCRQTSPPPDNQEFRKVWQSLAESDNWCFGEQRLDETRDALQKDGLPTSEQSQLWRRLAQQHLRLNHNEEAKTAIEKAVELAEPAQLPEMRAERGLVYLRLGEVRNCVLRGNQNSCIFPLDEKTVHLDQRPARSAFDDLLFYLNARKDNPTDLSFYRSRRWLLNIAAMQLGEYPELVPEEYRLELTGAETNPNLVFEDVAAGVGIIEKNLAGGAAAEDMNGDGLIDILSASCDFREPTRLYLNLGDGTFQDSTLEAGLQDQTGAFNVRTADYDGDGDQDVLLLRGAFLRELGTVRNSLLRNDGKGHFTDVTVEAGLAGVGHPTGTACWGDFNGDGKLDLFIGNETITHEDGTQERHPNEFYLNNGDGTFTEQAEKAGVEGLVYAKGVATADIDNDGDLDLFCTDFTYKNVPDKFRGRNLLFRNRGDATFEEVGQEMGIDWPAYRGFACWFFDYDNDGWQDLFVACYETEVDSEVSRFLGFNGPAGRTALYRNNEGQSFTNVSYEVGLSAVMSTMGASFGDLDHDGWLDMYLGTGSAFYDHLVPNLMLQNRGGQFDDVTFRHGLGHLQKGHGIVFCDFDNDGDQDIYAQMGGNFVGDAFSNSLFMNPGNDNHRLYLTLKSDFQVVGARIEVVTQDRSFHRAVGMVSSFGHTPLRQEIGLGRISSVDRLIIRWPSGVVQEVLKPPLDKQLRITEGNEKYEELDSPAFQLRRPQPGDPFCEPLAQKD